MKEFIGIFILFIGLLTIGFYIEGKRDPYDIGMHMDYSISCENGFKYKTLSRNRGTILILNSDGTPLKCNQKKY